MYRGRFGASARVSSAYFFPESAVGSNANGSITISGTYMFEGLVRSLNLTHGVASPITPNVGTISARFFISDQTAPSGRRLLVSPELPYVRLNGFNVGRPNSTGSITLVLAPGRYRLDAVLPSRARISPQEQPIDVSLGQALNWDIVLNDEGETAEYTELISPDCLDGILDGDWTQLRLKFVLNGTAAQIADFSEVTLLGSDQSLITRLDSAFTVASDGSIVATDINTLRASLAGNTGRFTLRVSAEDRDGFAHYGELEFYVGSYALTGKLEAPPSAPKLPISGIAISIWTLEGFVGIKATSLPDGTFVVTTKLPQLPILIRAETLFEGKHYYGSASFLMLGAKSVTIKMNYATDVVNGVPPHRLAAAP